MVRAICSLPEELPIGATIGHCSGLAKSNAAQERGPSSGGQRRLCSATKAAISPTPPVSRESPNGNAASRQPPHLVRCAFLSQLSGVPAHALPCAANNRSTIGWSRLQQALKSRVVGLWSPFPAGTLDETRRCVVVLRRGRAVVHVAAHGHRGRGNGWPPNAPALTLGLGEGGLLCAGRQALLLLAIEPLGSGTSNSAFSRATIWARVGVPVCGMPELARHRQRLPLPGFPAHVLRPGGRASANALAFDQFTADFEDACARLGIPLAVAPPRRPQWNGFVERASGVARTGLWSFRRPRRLHPLLQRRAAPREHRHDDAQRMLRHPAGGCLRSPEPGQPEAAIDRGSQWVERHVQRHFR